MNEEIEHQRRRGRPPKIDNDMAAPPKTNLVLVAKDGDTAEVHPSTLEDHKRCGWKQVIQE